MGGINGMDVVPFKITRQLLLAGYGKLDPDEAEGIPRMVGIGMGIPRCYNEGIPFFNK